MAFTIISTITAAGAPRTSSDNSGSKAIARCMRAWNYAYKKEAADLDEDDNDYDAKQAANEAYLRATPPLCGYKNICDFIACINFASMTDIVSPTKAQHYLANAKIAISALCHQPKPLTGSSGEPKCLGRPPKSEAAAGN